MICPQGHVPLKIFRIAKLYSKLARFLTWNFAPHGFVNILDENNQTNAPDVICRKEQQIELLNQTSRIERSPKAQLYR